MTTTRILLADDHRIVLDGLRLFLESLSGMEIVAEAGTSRDTIAALEKVAVDVAVLDLNMPDVDGLSHVKQIRDRWPSVRVVILSGSIEGDQIEEALIAGVRAYVSKESATRLLASAIEAAVSDKVYLCPDSALRLAEWLRKRHLAGLQGTLSPQEARLLRGIAAGLSYKEIASELNVTPKSVETYRRRLGKKLGLSTRAEFVAYAAKRGYSQDQ